GAAGKRASPGSGPVRGLPGLGPSRAAAPGGERRVLVVRPIRILKTIPVRGGLRRWRPAQERLVQPLLHPGLVVEWADLPEAPVEEIETSFDSDLVALPHLRLAVQAEAQGYDAVAMGCLDEPGVAAAREACRIPVTG